MSATAKKDERSRQSIRLQPEMWEAIDALRAQRGGVVSRNTWIAEAVLEKLAREQDTKLPSPPSRRRHA
jgi:hypothetical protein